MPDIMFEATKSVTDKSMDLLFMLDQELYQEEVSDAIWGAGDTALIAISLVAFGWLSYMAVAKFREVQTGRAEWSELLVMLTGIGALLFVIALFIANAAGILATANDGLEDLAQLKQEGKLIEAQTRLSLERLGKLLVLGVSIIAFGWVSYEAVNKFRECQSGRAEWSELLVLGVAAGALLVLVTLLLSEAGGLLVGEF